jgi:hypothetical protein
VNDSASPQILGVRVQGGKYGIASHHVQSCPVPHRTPARPTGPALVSLADAAQSE